MASGTTARPKPRLTNWKSRSKFSTSKAVRRAAAMDAPALTDAAATYLAALDPHISRIIDKMPGNFLDLGCWVISGDSAPDRP